MTGFVLLLPVIACFWVLKVGLSRPPVNREGRGFTREEWQALGLALVMTPLLWLMAFGTGYYAILTIPLFGILQNVAIAVAARTTRPVLIGYLGALPFHAVFITLALLNGLTSSDRDWLIFFLVVETFIPLLFTLPLQYRANRHEPPFGA